MGFPSASQPDFDFVRQLVEEDLIPDDVIIQVLTQARPELIERTYESLRGRAAGASSTSTTPPPPSSAGSSSGWTGPASWISRCGRRDSASDLDATIPECDVHWQYSPESFTGTELDFAVEICEAVMDVWKPTHGPPDDPQPARHRGDGDPNIYADQIEWFLRHIRERDSIILSLHPHNDRGTAVAAAELGGDGGRRSRSRARSSATASGRATWTWSPSR